MKFIVIIIIIIIIIIIPSKLTHTSTTLDESSICYPPASKPNYLFKPDKASLSSKCFVWRCVCVEMQRSIYAFHWLTEIAHEPSRCFSLAHGYHTRARAMGLLYILYVWDMSLRAMGRIRLISRWSSPIFFGPQYIGNCRLRISAYFLLICANKIYLSRRIS